MWQSYLKLIKAVGVFAKLHHATKRQYSNPITDKAMGSTAGRDVTPHRRQEPLLWDWNDEQMSVNTLDFWKANTTHNTPFTAAAGKMLLQTPSHPDWKGFKTNNWTLKIIQFATVTEFPYISVV